MFFSFLFSIVYFVTTFSLTQSRESEMIAAFQASLLDIFCFLST